MIRPVVFLVVPAACLLLGASSTGRARPLPSDRPFVPGEVILRFTDDASPGEMKQVLAGLGSVRAKGLGRPRVALHRLRDLRVEDAVLRFRGHPKVACIEPNYIVRADAIPDDPYFPRLHGLLNTGQLGGTPGADIHAVPAWNLCTGSPDVVIGVIDTGVDYLHVDLAANLWTNPGEVAGNGIDDDGNGFVDDVHGYDFYNEDGDPMDDNGHGTHIAGTLGAVGNNAIGVTGVNWTVRIMALKFLNAGGSGTVADAIAAINYSVAMGAQITNNSWGSGSYSQALRDAIDAADAAGALFVASAGGGGSNNDLYPKYPASYPSPGIVAVAGTDADDNLAGFSAWGATSVDLAAPGEEIFSTFRGNSYRVYSGTSMATAFVSGAAGLVLARVPTIGHLAIKDRLLESVDVKPGLLGKCVTGGRLNLHAALALPAMVTIEPSTLNLGSGGVWVTAYLELPADRDPARVMLETVVLNGAVPADVGRCRLGDWNRDGIPDWMLKFDRSAVEQILAPGDSVPVTVGGEIRGTAWFQAVDVIRVIRPRVVDAVDGGPLENTGFAAGVEPAAPAAFRLHPAAPNPFRGATRIRFDLPRDASVRVRVFDSRGSLVRTLADQAYPAGTHQVTWDGRDDDGRMRVPGIYFCRVDAGANRRAIRVALIGG